MNLMDCNSPVVTIAAASASNATQLGRNRSEFIRVINSGTAVIFFRVGGQGVTASATDCPILPGGDASFEKDSLANYIAVICPGGTSTVYAQVGGGA